MYKTDTDPLLGNRPGKSGQTVSDHVCPIADYASINSEISLRHCQSSRTSHSDVLRVSDISTHSASSVSYPEFLPALPGELRVYKRRWYILIMYSLVSATQCGVCYTFGPIAASLEEAFGWTDATIALLNSWPPIVYLFVGVVFSWLLDVKGLRISCLLMGLFVAIGTTLRCITMEPPAVTWLMHIGQLLTGLAGPVAMATPPYLSVTWFPPHERTTATAVGCSFASIGIAVSFILGPELIPGVPFNSTNSSLNQFSDFQFKENKIFHDSSTSWIPWTESFPTTEASGYQRISQEKKAIQLYMYIVAGWSIGLFLIMLIYFPNKPPHPPSASASIQRTSFLAGLKHLSRRGQFWLVCSVNCISMGVLGAWNGVLDVVLKPHGIGEKQVGWIGFYGHLSAFVVSLIVARCADAFSKMLKWLIIGFYLIGTISFLVITLTIINVIPSSIALLYTFTIVGVTVLNAASPLIFEVACELAYPTGEGTTSGILSVAENLVIVIFLLVMMIPSAGTMWTNWTIVGSSGFSLLLLLFLKEKYNRLEIDNKFTAEQKEQCNHGCTE